MEARINGAEPLLVRANKLDLLEEVADDLAHEIKNPLHSMVINLEVLKRRIGRLEGNGSADMLRYADVVGAELERVSHRVDLLLRMVRPARDEDRVPLADVLDELRELIEIEVVRRGVSLRFDPGSRRAGGSVPRELGRQVVLNVVLAVLHRIGGGGELHVAATAGADALEVHVAGGPTAGEAAVAVASADERVEVARLLGERLGGTVRTTHGEEHFGMVLSLPLPPV